MSIEVGFRHVMQSSAEAIGGARRRFEGWLRAMAVDGEAREDLTVVMSELGANAVAASVRADARIEVRAWWEGSVVVLEVENAGMSAEGGVIFYNEVDPLRGHGQGLLIVAAYTDSVEVIPPRDDMGMVVRCRKDVSMAS